MEARALLDSGAGLSLISTRVAQMLNLPLKPTQLQLSVAQGAASKPLQHLTTIHLSPLFNKGMKIPCHPAVTPAVTADLPSRPVQPVTDLPHLMGLQLADPTHHLPGRIDLLLGADMAPLIMTRQLLRSGKKTEPIAQSTQFGWVLSGPVNQLHSSAGNSTYQQNFFTPNPKQEVTPYQPFDFMLSPLLQTQVTPYNGSPLANSTTRRNDSTSFTPHTMPSPVTMASVNTIQVYHPTATGDSSFSATRVPAAPLLPLPQAARPFLPQPLPRQPPRTPNLTVPTAGPLPTVTPTREVPDSSTHQTYNPAGLVTLPNQTASLPAAGIDAHIELPHHHMLSVTSTREAQADSTLQTHNPAGLVIQPTRIAKPPTARIEAYVELQPPLLAQTLSTRALSSPPKDPLQGHPSVGPNIDQAHPEQHQPPDDSSAAKESAAAPLSPATTKEMEKYSATSAIHKTESTEAGAHTADTYLGSTTAAITRPSNLQLAELKLLPTEVFTLNNWPSQATFNLPPTDEQDIRHAFCDCAFTIPLTQFHGHSHSQLGIYQCGHFSSCHCGSSLQDDHGFLAPAPLATMPLSKKLPPHHLQTLPRQFPPREHVQTRMTYLSLPEQRQTASRPTLYKPLLPQEISGKRHYIEP